MALTDCIYLGELLIMMVIAFFMLDILALPALSFLRLVCVVRVMPEVYNKRTAKGRPVPSSRQAAARTGLARPVQAKRDVSIVPALSRVSTPDASRLLLDPLGDRSKKLCNAQAGPCMGARSASPKDKVRNCPFFPR